MNGSDIIFGVSDFVAALNQTIEFAYPSVIIQGELANFRVSKNKWVYFDLKDEFANVKFFGTVYQLPGPLEDGLMLQVRGNPRLHPQYGFSVTIQAMQPVGEGSIKRAAALLEAKLAAEGLFDPDRKRPLPYPPKRIGLITSSESAAYHDFVKVINERWGGVEVLLADVQVQGELAPAQIINALDYLNTHEERLDVVVITRGGGSAEDLTAFSTEAVTRAVAGSRIPTLVAIGHEVDVSLAELAADQRASTPSNAAQLLVPDKRDELYQLTKLIESLTQLVQQKYETRKKKYEEIQAGLSEYIKQTLSQAQRDLELKRQILQAFDPTTALRRGYAAIRKQSKLVTSINQLEKGDEVALQLHNGSASATISSIVKNT